MTHSRRTKFALRPAQTVLFIGDSITDCGRRDSMAPLGNGYVSQVAALIIARYPAHRLAFINAGAGGDTIRDLRDRWTDDCIRRQPDWLSVEVGINDCNQCLRGASDGVAVEEYAEIYDALLARATRETKARLILVDPFYVSTDRAPGSWRAQVLASLPKYTAVVERLARQYKARHVRTHALFQALLRHHTPDRFGPEPVHPNATGHLVIAHGWLEAMGW
jgi:lysophospholipase L1-like esterase